MWFAAVAPLWRSLAFFLAGVAGGLANGVAGGGTFITFPTMLALGVPPLPANLSTTVAIIPSFLSNLRGFRAEIRQHRPLIQRLVPVVAFGTGAGTALLLVGSSHTFERVVPWLIGAATLVFAAAPFLTRRLAGLDHHHPARWWLLAAGMAVTAAYGGYFGAGVGIMMLATMAIALPLELAEIQGIRSVLSLLVTVEAAVVFVVHGHLALGAIYPMFVGALIGGWLGTQVLLRVRTSYVRALIVAIGVATTVHLAMAA